MGQWILHAINLPELITYSLADYETLALRLANEPAMLAGLRKKLEQNRLTSPLFDTARYTRNLEDAYSHIWELWQSGLKPQPITVTGTNAVLPFAAQIRPVSP